MPFSESVRDMASVGLYPEGAAPSFLENVVGSASEFVKSYLEGQEKQKKKEKDKLDTYIAARKAGMKPAEIMKYIETGKFTMPTGEEDTLEMKKDRAAIAKDEAMTEKYKADKRLTMKKLYTRGSGGKVPGVQEQMRSDLRDKYNRGETLKPEEMKLLFGYQEKAAEDDFILPGAGGSGGKTTTLRPEYTPPQWLQNVIGSWHTPGMAAEQTAKEAAPAPAKTPAPVAAAPEKAPAATGQDFGYGKRADGSNKGQGYFGELKRPDGKVSTELSIGVDMDGKETEIPSLVPTLTEQEKSYLLSGGKPTKEIVQKAVAHAKKRIAAGKSPFAQPGEAPATAETKVIQGITYKRGSDGKWHKS